MHHITDEMRKEAFDLLDEVFAEVVKGQKDGTVGEFERPFQNAAVHHCLSQHGFCMAHGATRVVWVCDGYVLKFENHYSGYYCAHEEEVYGKAVAAGFGDMFAECEKLQKNFAGDIPVWIMECVDVNEDAVYTSSEFYRIGMEIEDPAEREAYFEDSYYEYDGCDAARERLELDYGMERVAELYNFLEKNDVNDVHDSNIGFNGRFYVLSDYAGF